MVEGLDKASHNDKATTQTSANLDLKEIYSKPQDKTSVAPSSSGLYGTGVIAGLEREGVLFKRTIIDNGISGLRAAAHDEWSHKGELVEKAVSGAVMGSAMRFLLPKQGVAKAIASTAMVGYFIADAAKPLVHGVKDAWSARNDHELNTASSQLSTNLGKFAIDSSIGMATGMIGAKGAGILLESKSASVLKLPGVSKLRQFDAWKEEQLTSTEKPVGRFLQNKADKVDGFFDKVQEDWNPFKVPAKPVETLTDDAKMARIVDTAQKVFHSHEGESHVGSGASMPDGLAAFRFHQVYNEAPEGMTHSDYLDHLIAQGKKTSELGQAHIHQEVPTVPVPEQKVPPVGVDAGPAVPDSVPGVEASSLTGKAHEAVSVKDSSSGTTPSASDPKLDLDPAVIAKVADVAKTAQGRWTKDAVMYAEYRDSVQGASIGVSDQTRVGSMLRPEYDHSSRQITELASQIDNADAVKKAGMLLNLHTRAALQVLAHRPDAIDYNNFADELHGFFVEGMRRAGVDESVMKGQIPTLTAVTDDKGSGYFTIPSVENVIDRPVTVVPIVMSHLKAVLTDILRHEDVGHNGTFPVIARFPENLRDDLIGTAVDNTMKAKKIDSEPAASKFTGAISKLWNSSEMSQGKPVIAETDTAALTRYKVANIDSNIQSAMSENAIPDTQIKIGKEVISKSEFFKRLLYAEANENTADFMGTASGGIGTPLSLGVLLQSLRKGGYLETRNVYGSQFEHGIEPHGIDRWRVKFCAEVMRQLEPNDSIVKEYADALDLYAQKASRPGETSYIFASVDQPGETINIPMHEWDAVIPHIVKAQLDTPLDALKTEKYVKALAKDPTLEPGEGDLKTLRDIIVGHGTTVRNIDTLANRMTDAVLQGKDQVDGVFNNKEFTIGQVFSAGLVAWLRSTRRGEDPTVALERISAISEQMRATYRKNNPHLTVLTPTVSTVMKVDTMRGLNVAARQAVSSLAGQNRSIRNWTETRADWFAGPTGVNLTGDLMDVDKKKKEMLGN